MGMEMMFGKVVGPASLLRQAGLGLLLSSVLGAQTAATGTANLRPVQPAGAAEPGIPVTSTLVQQKCGGCHRRDDKGNLSRISWERTTPEGWQQAVKRMVRLNGVQLAPEEAREVIRYLSNQHGLAPEEAKPVAYFSERRVQDETMPSDLVRDTCAACHAIAQPMSWRRSKEEWELLGTMHMGYFPVVEHTSFRRAPRMATAASSTPTAAPGATPSAPPEDRREPFEQALEWLAKTNPLHTSAWAEWQATMRTPKLTGRWLVTGSQPGRGPVTGEMTVTQGSTPDEFTTQTRLTFVRDGATLQTTGKSIVYTGYAWRGRSTAPKSATPKLESPSDVREVLMVSRDQNRLDGRLFWGHYQEFGMDVTLHRAGDMPQLLTSDTPSLRAGQTGQRVRLLGDALPTTLTTSDLDFGSGVTVKRIVEQTPSMLTLEVDVEAKAIAGKRDIAVKRTVLPGALAVYDQIDFIRTAPHAIGRLGGNTHPKGYVQFEAIAYHRGLDGKPDTADDVALGPVPVSWSMEEFLSTYGDDDKQFVGSLNDMGFFTPASEGPNPKRRFNANNYGDVWVVATYTPPAGVGRDGKPLTSRCYMVVTVPAYVRWDQPEVAE